MRLYLTTLLVICSLASFSQSQLEMNLDAGDRLATAEKQLDEIYASILTEYKSDTVFTNALVKSQDIWTKFRDAELKLKFPHEERGYYGSVKPMCVAFYLTTLTNERIEALQVWTEGIEEGDVCTGSVKRK